jgi:hypothetical protein
MFVSVIHHITDPDRFFAMVKANTGKLPPDLRLPQYFTSADRSTAVCLWDAPSVARVQELLEPLTSGICENDYAEVDTSLSAGLPAATVA